MSQELTPLHEPGGELLSEMQYKFVCHYVATHGRSRIESAISAGASPERARFTAYDWMKMPKIRRLIKHMTDEVVEDLLGQAKSADAVLRETAKIAFADPRNMFNEDGTVKPIHELDERTAGSIAAHETIVTPDGTVIKKVKHHDKLKALNLLGTFNGTFIEKKQVNVVYGLADRMAKLRAKMNKGEVTDVEEVPAGLLNG